MLLNILLLIVAFSGMELVAWFTHKYIMHGLFWNLHKDHHLKEEEGILERNDSFFLFFAIPAIILFAFGAYNGINDPRIWIASGITLYGLTYFLVHDVFIHQRIKMFRHIDSVYFRAIRRAHKMHHKNTGKDNGTCFGMLWVPLKYLKQAKDSSRS